MSDRDPVRIEENSITLSFDYKPLVKPGLEIRGIRNAQEMIIDETISRVMHHHPNLLSRLGGGPC